MSQCQAKTSSGKKCKNSPVEGSDYCHIKSHQEQDETKPWYIGITEKQRKFIEAFVGEAKGNATEAARLAGYSQAEASGHENLRKPKILEKIEMYRQQVQQSGEYPMITPDRIHKEWLSLLDDKETTKTEKITLLRDAARSNAMFTEKIEHSGNIGGQIVIIGGDINEKEWEKKAISYMEAMLKVVADMKGAINGG